MIVKNLLKDFLENPENEDLILYATDLDDNHGICVKCREIFDHIEPDAERHHCPNCAYDTVYGAENLLLRL